MIDYDLELQRHHQALRRAFNVRPHERVLDIGSGAGETTRDVAFMAKDGNVFGIDPSEPALRRARQLTLATGLRNVNYVCGDAAQHPFRAASLDVAISRFGTMFFANPVTAFANIRSAMRPGGRLVMMVWQAIHRNAWAVAIHRALVDDEVALPAQPVGPSAFSFGDADTVKGILRASAFIDIAFEEVHESVYYGPDVESAVAFVSGFSNVTSAVASRPASERELVFARLREVMETHCTRDGVWFDSRAWIVTARCG